MNNEIISAIEERKRLRINYNGGWRILEPYCYGISNGGRESLRAYQIEGYSRKAKNIDWKFINIYKIKELQLLDETFYPDRLDYRREDKTMRIIYKQI